jgi:hypothetical protein
MSGPILHNLQRYGMWLDISTLIHKIFVFARYLDTECGVRELVLVLVKSMVKVHGEKRCDLTFALTTNSGIEPRDLFGSHDTCRKQHGSTAVLCHAEMHVQSSRHWRE